MSTGETAYLLMAIVAVCVFASALAYGSWHASHQ